MTDSRPMSEHRARSFAIALAGVLILSVAVGFPPAYWPSAVAIDAIALLGLVWALRADSFALDASSLPACVAMALIAVWGPAQLLFGSSVAPWRTARASIDWVAYGLAFVTASQILASERARHLFLNILLWAATVFAVLAMLQMSTSPPLAYGIFPADDSLVGTFLYKNQFAAMMELAAPIALWRALRGRESPVAGLMFFAVLFAATVASTSRAGVILLAAEFICALAIALYRRRIPLRTAAVLAGGLVALAALASVVAGPQRIIEHFHEQHPYSIRYQLLGSTLRMIAERPWFGAGMGTWRLLYPRFATFDIALVANEAHSDWAQWAAEGGIPFVCLMLVLVVSTLRAGFSTTWGLGVLMVMIHSLIDYPTRAAAPGLLWFSLAGALLHAREPSRSGPRRGRSGGPSRGLP